MSRLLLLIATKILPVRRAQACDPFDFCAPSSFCPEERGCCPTGCICC
jgi:hypothetical protein